MDKRQALAVLIDHSYALADKVKSELKNKIAAMTEADVNALGTFLAMEKKKSLERNTALVSDIDQLVAKLTV